MILTKSIRLFCSFLIAVSLLDIAYAATSSTEAISIMQQLQEQGKVPAYVLEQGKYKYLEGIRTVHVKGKNVFMRSQPLKNARIITKLTHVDLEYLGEWRHPKSGERWVCVRRNSEVGWIYGKYINFVKENTVNKKSARTHSDNEHYNENSHNVIINWSYLFWGVLILGIAYVITSYVLEWEFNIGNFFTFLFYAFLTIVVIIFAYFILKFIWEKIILPNTSWYFLVVWPCRRRRQWRRWFWQ